MGQAVGGILGTAGGIISAAQNAAAQGQAGNAILAQQNADRSQALGFAAASPQQTQALQQQLAVTNQQVQQGKGLLSSYSPAAQAAGTQALDLMNGKSAASLAPLMNQRAQQRAQLQQQLQQQLGPGYATSSAGIQALNNFDQATSNVTANAQQQAIGNYMGYAQGGAQLGGNLMEQGAQGMLSNVGIGQRQQGMQIGAIENNQVNPSFGFAGDFANANLNGQMAGSFGSLMGNAGTLFGGTAGIGGGNTADVGVNSHSFGDYGMQQGATGGMGDRTLMAAHGGRVPGKAMLKGDHPSNDTVKALLSPGEIVIPRTHAKSAKKAKEFVEKQFKGGKVGVHKGKKAYSDGTDTAQQMQQQPAKVDYSQDPRFSQNPYVKFKNGMPYIDKGDGNLVPMPVNQPPPKPKAQAAPQQQSNDTSGLWSAVANAFKSYTPDLVEGAKQRVQERHNKIQEDL